MSDIFIGRMGPSDRLNAVLINIPQALDRLCYRYPSMLVDTITEYEVGRRLVAIKNVTVNEEFFQGHFPGSPLMPGVLMLESLSQVAAILLLQREDGPPNARVYLRGVNHAKFRRQVVPGDRLRLEVSLERRRASLARAQAAAYLDDQVVAECELLLGVVADRHRDRSHGHRPSRRPRSAQGTTIGPTRTIGPHVKIGAFCRVGASSVIDGWTEIGEGTEIYPFSSIGLVPQDLKFRGEKTRLVIGKRNIFREFVTIHRGTRGGGGVTEIGDRNVFMAYVHIAHDCHVGNDTIFGNQATLGGHVTVEDFANVSAGSGCAPVLPRRAIRVHRRILGGDEGRDAVCPHRGQPRTHLRLEHHWSDAARISARSHQQIETVVPLPAPVEAQHDKCAAPD